MKKIIEYFVKNSTLVNIITFSILVIGVYSALSLRKEIFPDVNFKTIIVNTVYVGASAEEVEEKVSIPIERKILGLAGVKELNMMSGEGFSVGYVVVEPDYNDIQLVNEMKSQIDSIDGFPDDVKPPRVFRISPDLRDFIKIPLSGNNAEILREVVKELRDKINLIPGVGEARLEGYKDRIIDVQLDPRKLRNYDLSVEEVRSSIRQRNIELTAGNIKNKKGESLVRVLNSFGGAKDVANTIVRTNFSGKSVRVSDLGSIKDILDDEAVIQKVNGKEAIFIEVSKKKKADILKVSEDVKKLISDQATYLKEKGISFQFVDDQSYYVQRRLGVLKSNGTMGIVLCFLALLLFLNFRMAFITSIGAPVSFMIAFILMDYFGVTINLISMFALILVLGMLVDDSIIVAEIYYQKLEEGYSRYDAAVASAMETLAPVTLTILTTMVAFGVLFFLGGIWEEFLRAVPTVVIICLLGSWIECFLIMPNHLYDWVKLEEKKEDKKPWYQPGLNAYSFVLSKVLTVPKTTIIIFALILSGAVFVNIKFLKKELFPSDDVQLLVLNFKGKVGSPRVKTSEMISKVENSILSELKNEELEALRSRVGKQMRQRGTRTGSHYASMLIYLTMQNTRIRNNDKIIDAVLPQIKKITRAYNFEYALEKVAGGPPRRLPINVELRGKTIEGILEGAKKVEDELKSIDGVTSTEIDFEEGKKEIVLSFNETRLKELGLNPARVALEMRGMYQGDNVTEINRDDEEIDIRVRLSNETRKDPDQILNQFVLNNQGRKILVSDFASLSVRPGTFFIRRFQGRRTMSVSASIDNKKTSVPKVNQAILLKLPSVLPASGQIKYELVGENKDTDESLGRLKKASLVAAALIFVLLVAFIGSIVQPFIIMMAIPFSLIGVVLIFFALDTAIGFMAYLGMLGLCGVVVNDSIVLVTYINRKLQGSDEAPSKPILKACLSRFRPVILTTVTTVVGLLPVAHASGGDPFIRPMALSFAYGLIFSTSITLFLIPCLCLIWEDIKRWYAQKNEMELIK